MSAKEDRPLNAIRVVNLGLNVPGPVAAARLASMGARVLKVEPPVGDPLREYAPDWYARLRSEQELLQVDLRTPDGRAVLDARLRGANVLITSQRPSALARLRLDRRRLEQRYPTLIQIAIIGDARRRNEAGHDLTYLAPVGLLQPPRSPATLLADLGGAERVVSAVLLALLARRSRHAVRYVEIPLAAVARDFAAPAQHGLTVPAGILGGGLPAYGLYRAADGWIAVAALEPHFQRALEQATKIPRLTKTSLARFFSSRSAAAWERWGRDHDLPVRRVLPARRQNATYTRPHNT